MQSVDLHFFFDIHHEVVDRNHGRPGPAERECQRRSVTCGRIPNCHGTGRRYGRRHGAGCDRHGHLEPPPLHRSDHRLSPPVIPDGLSRGCDARRDCALGHDPSAPDSLNDGIPGDQTIGVLSQKLDQLEDLRFHLDLRSAAAQAPSVGVEDAVGETQDHASNSAQLAVWRKPRREMAVSRGFPGVPFKRAGLECGRLTEAKGEIL